MNDRDIYPNLPNDVSIHHCTKTSPMMINGDDAVKLKQLWIHDDATETIESEILDGTTMFLFCPNCNYSYSADLSC